MFGIAAGRCFYLVVNNRREVLFPDFKVFNTMVPANDHHHLVAVEILVHAQQLCHVWWPVGVLLLDDDTVTGLVQAAGKLVARHKEIKNTRRARRTKGKCGVVSAMKLQPREKGKRI